MTKADPGAGRVTVRRPRRLIVAAAAIPAILLMTGCTIGHRATGSSGESETYGPMPTFLPTVSVEADSELTGTATSPAITSQGDSVKVQFSTGSFVHATVSGPDVPGEGMPYQTEATTCTWTFTLSGATAVVPVRLADFTASDHLGNVYRLHAFPGHPTPPTAISPGQRLTFQLQAVMPTGEGLMRWAPQNSVLASWDFEVEND